MCWHRDPALVLPLHCVDACFSPEGLAVPVVKLCPANGLQILQGSRPAAFAAAVEMAAEVFFTVRQSAVWYFFPDGVL